MKQQFIVEAESTFQTYIYEDNLKIIPTSATITVFNPGGDTEIVSAQAMTVASDGLLSYTLTADNNETADINYRVKVFYVFESVTFPVSLFYDVVNSILHIVITDDDVGNELPQLRDNGWRTHGTADSGSATTIVDDDLVRYADDYFTGGLAHSLTLDETRKITDFASSTGTVTTEAFGTAISTDKYILTRSFTNEIQRAFDKLVDMLNKEDKRADLILDSDDLKQVHIIMSAEEVCRGLTASGTEGTFWWDMWKQYEKKGREMFKSLNFKYDSSDDGFISESEETTRLPKRLGRG